MMTQTKEPPIASFTLSIVAGLLILGGSAVMLGAWYTPYNHFGMMQGYYGMMGGFYGMAGGTGWYFAAWAISAVTGAAVLACAIMLYRQPPRAPTWGLLIVVFSVVSFFGMGGFFLGAVLGLVGGILAMTYRP